MEASRRGVSRAAIVVCGLAAVAAPAGAGRTLYVAPTGSDQAGDGSAARPWRSLVHASSPRRPAPLRPGDTVIARAGHYQGFELRTSGTADAPIRFIGEPGAVIDRANPKTPDGINLETASFVHVEGFELTGVGRAGIRAQGGRGVVVRRNVARANGVWGIFTAFCDDVVIEDNDASDSREQHGIYVSNSGDRPTIRGNRIWNNRQNGIHINGDASMGGDGVISGALVEANVIHGNGRGGGSGINCDGVQDSVIRNNLLYDNHASGIALYRINGGTASRGNTVAHNTIVMASDARWGILIRDGSEDNVVVNNIVLSLHAWRGALAVDGESLAGLRADYNLVTPRFSVDRGEGRIELADWRRLTRQDAHSKAARAPDEVFTDWQAGEFRPRAGGPAVDAADPARAVATDLTGAPRGDMPDLGALEVCEGSACAAVVAAPGIPTPQPALERSPANARSKGCAGCGTAPAMARALPVAIAALALALRRRGRRRDQR